MTFLFLAVALFAKLDSSRLSSRGFLIKDFSINKWGSLGDFSMKEYI